VFDIVTEWLASIGKNGIGYSAPEVTDRKDNLDRLYWTNRQEAFRFWREFKR
jgi:hypothetical protein